MQDIAKESFDTLEGVGLLEIAYLSLDERKLESFIFNNNKEANVDDVEENEIRTIKDKMLQYFILSLLLCFCFNIFLY